MITIGLTGKARAGKSAVAEILRDRHGFAIIGFADTLKSMALAIDPVIPIPEFPHRTARLSQIVEWAGWERAKDRYPEVRRFLQKLGTEGVRDHLGADAWVYAWAKKVDEAYRQGAVGVAVPDVRFDNEAQEIRARGHVWRVVRPGGHGASAAGHVSENDLPDGLVTLEINNNSGSLDNLGVIVDRLMWEAGL